MNSPNAIYTILFRTAWENYCRFVWVESNPAPVNQIGNHVKPSL